MGENVVLIFKRALTHYIKVLEKLKDDEEIEFSNEIFRSSIQDNIDKLNEAIKGLDSTFVQDTLDRNRELLCCSLQSYIDGLKKMKDLIISKLQSSEPSLPPIQLTKVEYEIALAKRIQMSSCFEQGFGNPES